jgi:Arc-like DNA binding domain
MARKPGIVSLQVRMPEEVRKELAIDAAKSGRSLNSEIVWRLVQSLPVSRRSALLEHQEQTLTFDEKVKAYIAEKVKEGLSEATWEILNRGRKEPKAE